MPPSGPRPPRVPGLPIRAVRHAWWQVLRRLRRELLVRTPQGRFFVSTADQAVGKYLYIAGQHEYDLSREVIGQMRAEGLLPEGDVQLLDIGANIGVIAIGLVRAGLVQRAVAIEPEPRNFDLLCRNIAVNGLEGQVTARREALGHLPGAMTMELAAANFGDHRIRVEFERVGPDRYAEAQRSTIEVPVTTLDTVATEEAIDPACCLIWIDVQGFEAHVFRGGASFLTHAPPTLAEVWPYGILRAGLTLDEYATTVAAYWSRFWVSSDAGWIQHDIHQMPELLQALGADGRQANVILAGPRGDRR